MPHCRAVRLALIALLVGCAVCGHRYAAATGNPKWRYLTWGMLPLHASGIAACTYHFFYNSADVSSLVALQATLTLTFP